MPFESTPCPARRWTRVYAGPSVGGLNLAAWPAGTPARYRVLTLNLPFYVAGEALLGDGLRLFTGLPSVYTTVDVWPQRDVNVSVG